MLITFKSPASGDVMMFDTNARELLALLGKDPQATAGAFTVEQMPAAIALLDAAMRADRVAASPQPATVSESGEEPEISVRLSQRAMPLRELLDRSLTEKVPATWGV